MSPFGVSIIATFEKFRASAYPDAAGKPTIGYGHLIKRGEVFPKRITKARALRVLALDVKEAERAVDSIGVWLTGPEHDALVSWTFNCGAGALRRSTLLKRVRDSAPSAAAREMLRWNKAGGRVLKGLVRRRHCEAVWFLGAPEATVRYLAEL